MSRVGLAVVVGLTFALTAAQAPAAPSPDLAVRSVTAPPGAADRLEVKVVLAGARPGASVGFYLSADRAHDGRDRRLRAAGKARGGGVLLPVPQGLAGRAAYVIACADDTKEVAETNERNNCTASQQQVGFVQPFRPRPLHVSERLDAARAAKRTIGPGGGAIETRAANGTRFRLVIPSRALGSETEITMTPLAALGGLPYRPAPLGAVRLEPSGLFFARAATLTITHAKAVPPAERAPFATESGRNFHLYPPVPKRRAVELAITHFSTYGFARWSAPIQATQVRRVPADRVGWAEQNLARAITHTRLETVSGGSETETGGGIVSATYVASYVYGNEVVGPLLEAALTNDAVFADATQALAGWERQIELMGQERDAKLAAMADRFQELWARAFLNAVRKTTDRCFRGSGPADAVRLLGYVRWAKLHGIDIGESVQTVAKCLRFELTFTTRIDSGPEMVSEVRVANVPIESGLDGPSLPVSRPLEYVWRYEDDECDEAGTPVQQRPFSVLGADLDLDHPGGPHVEHMTLDIDYGYATTPHTNRAEVFADGGTVCEDPEHFLDAAHYALVLMPHLPIADRVNRIRISRWRPVGGSTWAIERVYAVSEDGISVRTRFFLRHAPKR